MSNTLHHIFYVQSGIAYALTLAIIEENAIPSNQVIFLTGRNFRVSSDFQQYDMVSWETKKFPLNFLKGWRHIYEVYSYCNQLLDKSNVNQFKFYTASNTKTFLLPFFNHKKRIATYFLEEGYTAYFTKEEYTNYITSNFQSSNDQIFRIKVAVNTLFLLNMNPLQKIKELEKYDAIYTCSPESFKWLSTPKKLLTNPFKSTYTSQLEEVNFLMAFSYPVEKGFIDLDNYLEALKEVFTSISQAGNRKIDFKFHPQQTMNAKNLAAYRSLFESFQPQLEFIELPNDTTLEFLFSNKNLVLLTDYSSIILYSEAMKITSISICNILSSHSDKFHNCYNTLPFYLKEIIQKRSFNLQRVSLVD